MYPSRASITLHAHAQHTHIRTHTFAHPQSNYDVEAIRATHILSKKKEKKRKEKRSGHGGESWYICKLFLGMLLPEGTKI